MEGGACRLEQVPLRFADCRSQLPASPCRGRCLGRLLEPEVGEGQPRPGGAKVGVLPHRGLEQIPGLAPLEGIDPIESPHVAGERCFGAGRDLRPPGPTPDDRLTQPAHLAGKLIGELLHGLDQALLAAVGRPEPTHAFGFCDLDHLQLEREGVVQPPQAAADDEGDLTVPAGGCEGGVGVECLPLRRAHPLQRRLEPGARHNPEARRLTERALHDLTKDGRRFPLVMLGAEVRKHDWQGGLAAIAALSGFRIERRQPGHQAVAAAGNGLDVA